jgi:hypothetical protein
MNSYAVVPTDFWLHLGGGEATEGMMVVVNVWIGDENATVYYE